jgi:hypothetical protein
VFLLRTFDSATGESFTSATGIDINQYTSHIIPFCIVYYTSVSIFFLRSVVTTFFFLHNGHLFYSNSLLWKMPRKYPHECIGLCVIIKKNYRSNYFAYATPQEDQTIASWENQHTLAVQSAWSLILATPKLFSPIHFEHQYIRVLIAQYRTRSTRSRVTGRTKWRTITSLF